MGSKIPMNLQTSFVDVPFFPLSRFGKLRWAREGDPIPADLLFPHAAVISPNLSLSPPSQSIDLSQRREEEREDKGENPVTSQVINGAKPKIEGEAQKQLRILRALLYCAWSRKACIKKFYRIHTRPGIADKHEQG